LSENTANAPEDATPSLRALRWHLPPWSATAPAIAWLLLILLGTHVLAEGPVALLLAAAALGATVFAAVHHAEVLALRLGEPFGSILLAVAVTVIEVGLILSLILSGADGVESVARDTIFSAVMIATNGVVGICLVVGGRRHGEQAFRTQGAASALAVLGTLAVLTLVMPVFTQSAPGPTYSAVQLAFVAVASLVLYAVFVLAQTVRHRDYFLDLTPAEAHGARPTGRVALVSLGLLILCLIAVVLLAKVLSHPLDDAVAAAGLPQAFVGVVVAMVVLLPESIAAIKAAIGNRLQTSLNLALGSAIASIGLTIPAVAAVTLLIAQPIELGLSPTNIVLLALTIIMGAITLGTGRTTMLQGAVHLVIAGFFLMVSIVP
jgi:Ca2+:H+ antiporter